MNARQTAAGQAGAAALTSREVDAEASRHRGVHGRKARRDAALAAHVEKGETTFRGVDDDAQWLYGADSLNSMAQHARPLPHRICPSVLRPGDAGADAGAFDCRVAAAAAACHSSLACHRLCCATAFTENQLQHLGTAWLQALHRLRHASGQLVEMKKRGLGQRNLFAPGILCVGQQDPALFTQRFDPAVNGGR